jgi:23S rRNA (cytidine1920-2'-O)/16S rRNA (cytidine1409-2'-O)-methyltransferase
VSIKKSVRLDHYLKHRYPEESRQRIQESIKAGLVSIDGVTALKTSMLIADNAVVVFHPIAMPYVSRAGFKLAYALDHFQCNVAGLIVLDAGLSTGGFADCLLQRGAKKIFGVDVGHDQVHERIKNDSRLVVMEGTNLKAVTALPDIIDMVTLDLSFISILKVMDSVTVLLKPGGQLIVLIKPQFESGLEYRGKKGIITDPAVHTRVIDAVKQGIVHYGFECKGIIESPILGGSGNKEFLGYFVKNL